MTQHAESDELIAVCKALDELALSYLEKLDEYTKQWKATSHRLQQGFLNLAHAKYAMGPGTISRFSYDERMKAQVKVQLNSDQNLVIQQPDAAQSEQNSENEPPSTDNEVGLRERRRKEGSEWIQDKDLKDAAENEEYEMNEKRSTTPSKSKKKTSKEDPLHWFGLLVSPSLRTSQADFKTATEQLIEQVNRLHELDAMEKEYRQLRQQKSKLTQALPEKLEPSASTREPSRNHDECGVQVKDPQPVLAASIE